MADTKTTSSKAKRVLIIEDERPLAHALELKLMSSGYETVIASTGAEGIKEAQAQPYNLILLDLIIPGIDGFGVLRELKSKKVTTPVIVLSNLGQAEDQERAKELGVREYFVKSNTPLAVIVETIRKFLK
ncbi:MAG: response regulator [Candidatus Peribacteraceae bacterium]|nr:response regulator [Candidatus Peribacteraceae bacterium]